MASTTINPPNEKTIRAMLTKHACPIGYHEVRTRMLGAIASPDPEAKPISVIASFWGGALPPFDTLDDANALLGTLVMGLWNQLSQHQDPKVPFKAVAMPMTPTAANLRDFGRIRGQEVQGFIVGLFNGAEQARLPERVHEAIAHLEDIEALLFGLADLMERTAGEPEDHAQITQSIQHLSALTEIMETKIHAVVLACTPARGLSGFTTTWPSIH
jgi:hypothetical protein